MAYKNKTIVWEKKGLPFKTFTIKEGTTEREILNKLSETRFGRVFSKLNNLQKNKILVVYYSKIR
jgi:hypothetical protein